MKIGYSRVSTSDQKLDAQDDELKKAGCDRIFSDIASGAKDDRTGLKDALSYLREGDQLVVWRLDRLGRSLRHLVSLVADLNERKIGFISLQEGLDTATPSGRMIFHIFASLAEFERELIRERTRAGLAAARARGRLGGRPRKLSKTQVQALRAAHQSKESSIDELCEAFGISRKTLYNYLEK